MNDDELASWLATEAGKLLLKIRGDIAPLMPGQQATYDVAALGDAGDRIANEFLLEQLAIHRPDEVVLSEESLDPQTRHQADRVWIIDPLDGTASFSRGYPGFAVHVALWESSATTSGQIVAAAVAVPMIGQTLSTADPKPIGLPQGEQKEIRIVTSPTNPPEKLLEISSALTAEFGATVSVERRGSVGAKVAHIINGHADVYLTTRGFNEWDIAAPLAIAQHYGLSATLPTGAEFKFNQADVEVPGALICRPHFYQSVMEILVGTK
ncbi:MAG: 3'(2'),5'-bisphosphate nucleotidase CysQ [Actinomycetales bacterium]|nr:3'(2'),5'-bisphosphate nucleotidase CysQ [Actinomycetales bacterium]